jgi:regulator of protease activity HflC (stomatin/prohibitin superfamily)
LRQLKTANILALSEAQTPTASAEARDLIVKAIEAVNGRIRHVTGFEFDKAAEIDAKEYSGGIQILAIEPRLDTPEDRLAFLQSWRADQKAAELRKMKSAEADGEAEVIKKVGKEVKELGPVGELIQRYQALENAATAGKSTIIFDSGGPSGSSKLEGLVAATLDKLEKEKE